MYEKLLEISDMVSRFRRAFVHLKPKDCLLSLSLYLNIA